jgi:hypothetical protein
MRCLSANSIYVEGSGGPFEGVMCDFSENCFRPNPVMDGAILAVFVLTASTLFAQGLLLPLILLEA